MHSLSFKPKPEAAGRRFYWAESALDAPLTNSHFEEDMNFLPHRHLLPRTSANAGLRMGKRVMWLQRGYAVFNS